MNDQNKTLKKSRNVRVNRKHDKVGAVVTSVLFALFVVLAVVVSTLLMYKPTYDDKPGFIMTDDSGHHIVVTDSAGDQVDFVRDNDRINVMILGKDRYAFNTDVMIIASYNVADGKISMMQIPRDTYIDVGRGNKKANSLLASFYNEALRNKEEDPMTAAVKGMEETFEKVFCITIDYYVFMDLNGFVKIVDAMGGVEVDVPFDMKYTDPYQNPPLKINLKKGLQTLNGNQAEQFIRFRADYVEGDIGRVDAQKIFISACINKLKNSFNVSTISGIAKEVLQYVKTDIPLSDLIYYAKQALSVDLGNMTMLTLPGIQGRQYDTSGTWYYFTYRDGTISAVNKYFNSYNVDVTPEMFDRDGALYDNEGSYMHSVFLTTHKDEESYTADGTEDIYIYKYNNSSKPSTTKATKATEQTTAPITETDSLETGDVTDESGLHIATDVPEDTLDVTEDISEPDVSDEPVETTGVQVTEEAVETTSVVDAPKDNETKDTEEEEE